MTFALVLSLLSAVPQPSLPSAPPVVLGVVVGNNKSPNLSRPPLQYADDDAAKYLEVLQLVASPGDLYLLTEPDADTAQLFPSLAARASPPTRKNLEAVAATLAARAEA